MMVHFTLLNDWSLSQVEKVALAITREIDRGGLNTKDRLPSINEFSKMHSVARDTVEKAYNKLKLQGYIASVPGSGYFVLSKKEEKLKVLLILNKLSAFKKEVYDSFIDTLGDKATVDLQLHHHRLDSFKRIIETNLGKYHYYVVMPHFEAHVTSTDIQRAISIIPERELIVLDKRITGISYCSQIYQDFENDVFDALSSATHLLEKYQKLVLIMDEAQCLPAEIIQGLKKYCKQSGKTLTLEITANDLQLSKGTVYIEVCDTELVALLKKSKKENLKVGKDIGIISYNESVLKEALGISVMTTNFKQMGRSAAFSILQNQVFTVRNPFYLLARTTV